MTLLYVWWIGTPWILAVHLWAQFPEAVWQESVHWSSCRHPLWSSRLSPILRQPPGRVHSSSQDWRLLLWTTWNDQWSGGCLCCHQPLWGSGLHPPLHEFLRFVVKLLFFMCSHGVVNVGTIYFFLYHCTHAEQSSVHQSALSGSTYYLKVTLNYMSPSAVPLIYVCIMCVCVCVCVCVHQGCNGLGGCRRYYSFSNYGYIWHTGSIIIGNVYMT